MSDQPSADRPVEAALDPDGDGSSRRRPVRLVGGAIVAVALVVGLAVAARSQDDEPTLRAADDGSGAVGDTTTSTTADQTGEPSTTVSPARSAMPLPAEDVRLVCPPAMLDLSGVAAEWSLVPLPDHLVGYDGPFTYDVTWEQAGLTVELTYPGPWDRNADAPPVEEVTLADGRTARLELRQPTIVADVYRDENDRFGAGCGSFWVSATGEGAREVVLAVAEAVQVRAPEGTVTVPDVGGLARSEAQDTLARSGLVPAGEDVPFGSWRDTVVVGQDPAPGVEVEIGAEVTIAVGLEATTTTTAPPPSSDVELPVLDGDVVCPFGRLRVDDVFVTEPEVWVPGRTVAWDESDDYKVLLTWPSRDSDRGGHAIRELEIDGRPALMHDGGDGQNLVYDLGPVAGPVDSPCRYLEVGVYGGPSIPERERRAEVLAADGIRLAAAPDGPAPDVVGLTVADAADTLARAGFVPDWGVRAALDEERPEPSDDAVVTAQTADGDGVVSLTT
ncbi:MAG: PASTA domain-containing protein [Actinomycetota bacterium]|nr:PASTA domain-containing protein [Actinomycetota bacterium]